MKKNFRSFLSIIAVICIVLVSLPLGLYIFAEEEPSLSKNCEKIISKPGINTNFGDKYNSIQTNSRITLSPTVDISSFSGIEFDIFIEDYNSFNSAIKDYSNSENQGFRLYFSSVSSAALAASKNNAYAEIANQITKSGWNHIILQTGDFTVNSIKWDAVKFVFVKFSESSTTSLGGLSSKELKLRNICSVISIPGNGEYENVIYNDIIRNTLGVDTDSPYSGISSRFCISGLNAVDISDCELLGFDVYTQDFESFSALITDNAVTAKIVLNTTNGNVEYPFSDLTSLANGNWYRVTVTLNKVDKNSLSAVTGYYIDIINENADQLNGAYAIELIIASVRGIDMSKPYEKGNYGEIRSDFGVDNLTVMVADKYEDFSISGSGNFGVVGDSEYVEFDFYCDNYDLFKKSFVKDKDENDIALSLDFVLSDTASNYIKFANIQNKLVYNGWNHIILPFADADGNSLSSSSILSNWSISIVGNDSKKQNPVYGSVVVLDDLYLTKYVLPNQTNLHDCVAEINKDGYRFNMMSSFHTSAQSHFETAVDLSNCDFVEFDFYIQNYDAWINAMKAGSNDLELRLSSEPAQYDYASRTAEFLGSVTKTGWNHICLPFGSFIKGSTSGDLQTDSIYSCRFFFGGNANSSTGDFEGQFLAAVNMCGTSITVPTEYIGVNTVVQECGFKKALGTYGEHFGIQLTSSVNEPINFNDSSFIEFDLYVENYEDFVRSFIEDANGKPVGVNLSFGIGRTTSYSESSGYYMWEGFEKQVKNQGWNHIVLAFGGQKRSKSDVGEYKTRETIQNIKLWYGGDKYKNSEYTNIIGNNLVILANIRGTAIVNPGLPENVLFQIGKTSDSGEFIPAQASSTLGDKFHYATDKYYQNKLDPYNFKGTGIECDVYIDDLDALIETESTSKRNSTLSLFFSSTPVNLWGQYTRPDQYYSAYVPITDKLTHNGWNHIRVGKADFSNVNQTLDWSAVTGWQLRFFEGSNVHPEDNPNPGIYIKICNIVNTGIISEIPFDTDKAAQPDKTAVYISSADSVVDKYGSWNPTLNINKNQNYKSEGTASISMDLSYKSEVDDATVFYLFDDSADLSDLNTLKFDLFVDLPQLFVSGKNKAEILLSDKRKIDQNYCKFDLSLNSLRSGWNSISLDVSAMKISGNVDISEIKNITFRFTELSIDANAFGEILMCIDNLRYISKTGNKTLRINLVDDTDSFIDDYPPDYDDSYDMPAEEIENETAQIEPEIKTINKLKTIVTYNLLVSGIVIGITLLLSAAAVIIFRKLRYKNK